jgi:aryl-alcohol dehydrogenase-like predicted oxidoreductase
MRRAADGAGCYGLARPRRGISRRATLPTEQGSVGTGDTLLVGDLPIRRIGFGAMRLTGPGTWGPPRDQHSAKDVLRRALELGVTLIDTADAYGPGVNERQIAEALHPYPEGLVIATKAGRTRQGPYQWGRDCRPASLRQACEASLRRLQLERIDLYQLHGPDPHVPLEESVGALAELQTEGKVRHIGICNVDAEQLARARAVATIISVQNRYNLADRTSETVLRVCERHQLAFLPWMPLARGTLAGRGSGLRRIAATHTATPGQVALAWLLQRSPVTVPIPGTSSVSHLEENLGALDVRLSEDELDALERYRPARAHALGASLRRRARPILVPVLASILRRR